MHSDCVGLIRVQVKDMLSENHISSFLQRSIHSQYFCSAEGWFFTSSQVRIIPEGSSSVVTWYRPFYARSSNLTTIASGGILTQCAD